MNDASDIKNFNVDNNNSASFKFKQKITRVTAAGGTKDVDFRRTLEMPLIDCENNLILACSQKCVLSNDTKATTFAITDKKLYVLAVPLSTEDNAKLLEQLKSGLKKTTNWNKYQS